MKFVTLLEILSLEWCAPALKFPSRVLFVSFVMTYVSIWWQFARVFAMKPGVVSQNGQYDLESTLLAKSTILASHGQISQLWDKWRNWAKKGIINSDTVHRCAGGGMPCPAYGTHGHLKDTTSGIFYEIY